ncbi:GGDEF domain protein [Catenovulum agarivorans DS-2]|uniref:diguanylate cyclase n=1 Tax=Catenovulum agarivorans DS-2 TaxID=1328313 RepID=W7QVN1_9ALTE|nr:diguanylate cyclase [Catenovulum agarivorans]EWH11778.1 GGDEF domain protein [Catenovulum agarivorans DS-2]
MKNLFIKSILLIVSCWFAVFSVNAHELTSEKRVIQDDALWHLVDDNKTPDITQLIKQYNQSSNAISSLLGRSGAALAKLPITAMQAGNWYVMPVANFVDQGHAYWQDELGNIKQLADFSQFQQPQSVVLMHGQAFKLTLKKPSTGNLWIYIKAKHYPTPAHIAVVPESQFIASSFVVNSLSIVTITVMLMLAIMALILFIKTRYKVAAFCFGYVGLHGLGWAMAAGLGQIIYPMSPVNTSYAGMYLFPFAIGCASYFAYYLFNFNRLKPIKNRLLVYYANIALLLGVGMLFLPFTWVFYLSHLLASIWVWVSLFVGYKMLSLQDFRAKYFFTGNLVYSLSLVYYMLSHFTAFDGPSPELVVMLALSIDCVCIVMSLSEWLRLKQQEFNHVMHQSRFDALTGVGNRLLLNEKLADLQNKYLVVFIDCDSIKQLNDQLGHAQGDQFLIYVADLMQQQLADLGQVFRTGGDEFIGLCEVNQGNDLVSLKWNIEKRLQEINIQVKQRWPASGISYGIATSEEGKSASQCLSIADSRMYEVKSQHKAQATSEV